MSLPIRAALILSILGLAAVSAPAFEGPCSMKVSKVWMTTPYPHWDLIALCGGICPSSNYNCQAFTDGFGTGDPGWTETCRCKDSQGNYATDPPCSGIVGFDPDLYGPEQPGYYIIGCDLEENCGTIADPRQCEQQVFEIEEVPTFPTDQRICLCEPL